MLQSQAGTRPLLPFHGELGEESEATREGAPVMELRRLAVTIPRSDPVAVIDGNDFLELAARLLPLHLRFLA